MSRTVLTLLYHRSISAFLFLYLQPAGERGGGQSIPSYEGNGTILKYFLDKNNNKAWFEEHRKNYEAAKTDFQHFTGSLIKGCVKDATTKLSIGSIPSNY